MSAQPKQFNIGVVATIYFPLSHADVIVSRWLEPRPDDPAWGWPAPRTRVASMYIAQYAENDMGRDIATRCGVPLYDTIRGALCAGGDRLAVDAVLLIGEHGDYPYNEVGQHLYPRKEMFDGIIEVFRESRHAVPIFCDKHLSWNLDWALDMHRTAKQMGFMLVSSSSIPLCRRQPLVDLAGTQKVTEAVAPFYGPDEAYGYHSFEFAQAILERRVGGETGVEAITVHRGDEVWRQQDKGAWSADLLDAALDAIRHERADRLKDGDIRRNCHNAKEQFPTAIVVDYRDGMRVTHLNLSGHITTWALAMRIEGEAQPLATAPTVDDNTQFHAHFATMSRTIEDAFVANRPPFAPERALMTTGLTAFAMHARAQPGTRLQTPQLAIEYEPLPYAGAFSLNDAR